MTQPENHQDPVADELETLHKQAAPGASSGDEDKTSENDALIPAADPKERGAPPSVDEGDTESADDGSGTSSID